MECTERREGRVECTESGGWGVERGGWSVLRVEKGGEGGVY